MGQRFDIVASKNETYQLTIDYTNSSGTPIALDTTQGTYNTMMTIRPIDNNSSTPYVIISAVKTVAPDNTERPGVFWHVAGSTGRVILHIPQPAFEVAAAGAAAAGTPSAASTWTFGNLTVNQKYYYDIIATTTTAPALKVKLLSGYFTLTSGITDA